MTGDREVINLGQGCLQHTADSAEDSKYVELFRNLVHSIVTSVTVLLAPLVHHLDKFCRKPLGIQRSSKKKFDEILTFFSPPELRDQFLPSNNSVELSNPAMLVPFTENHNQVVLSESQLIIILPLEVSQSSGTLPVRLDA